MTILPREPFPNIAHAFQSVPEPYWPNNAILRIGAPKRGETDPDPWVLIQTAPSIRTRQTEYQVYLHWSYTESEFVGAISTDGRLWMNRPVDDMTKCWPILAERLLSAEALSVAVLVTRIVEHSQNHVGRQPALPKPARSAAPKKSKPNLFEKYWPK